MPSHPSSKLNVVNPLVTTLGPFPQILIDTGSTGHYFTVDAPIQHITIATDPLKVKVANQQYIHSTHKAELPIDGLPKAARMVHIFPELGHSLLAIAPLCDHGCQVKLTKQNCTITLPNGSQLNCPRNTNGLWVMPTAAMNINQQPA